MYAPLAAAAANPDAGQRGRANVSEGKVRIIGGAWRGTRIAVAAGADLRPTPDRVRETVFNWLRPQLPGARCADLFAGTGVLGIEALSHDAASCVFVEQAAEQAAGLETMLRRLSASAGVVYQEDALHWLRRDPNPFDIVFIDPPFGRRLLEPVLSRLSRGWLAPEGVVYVECERGVELPEDRWDLLKAGHTKRVSYALMQWAG